MKDNFETESASFWYASPEVKSGEVRPEDIKTEVFLFPSAQVAEMAGSYTNTQRLIQFHEKAADPPGDARSDAWFTHQLALRLKRMYASSTQPRDQSIRNLTWDFDYDPGKYPTDTRIQGEPDALKIWHEIAGYQTESKQLLAGFGALQDDGSTTCASWIYSGAYPAENDFKPASRTPDPNNQPGSNLGWGYAWPANRRILYNRASARPDGQLHSQGQTNAYIYGKEDMLGGLNSFYLLVNKPEMYGLPRNPVLATVRTAPSWLFSAGSAVVAGFVGLLGFRKHRMDAFAAARRSSDREA